MLKNLYRLVSLIMVPSLVFLPVRGFAEPAANTLPTNGVVAGGDSVATLSTSGNTLTVNQNLNNAIINYDTFNIGSAATVQFNNAGMIALNRVGAEGGLSEIYGTLSASGRIFLINPNGILFGQGSQINTAGLLASTLGISDTDFSNGNYNFYNTVKEGFPGSVVNEGAITANSPGGFVALLAPNVRNSGSITANLGTIALASGSAVTLSLDPLNLISVAVEVGDPDSDAPGVVNSGTIQAAGGKVLINSQVIDAVLKNAVNNSGIIEAKDIEIIGKGNIALSAGMPNSGVRARAGSGEASVKIKSTEGNVSITGTEVSANIASDESTGNGDASVEIYAGAADSTIDIDDSIIEAEVENSGDASIDIVAGTYDSHNTPEANGTPSGQDIYGDNYGDGIVDQVETLSGTGQINIVNGSHVDASIGGQSDIEDNKEAIVNIKAHDVTINDSFVTATSDKIGASLINIYAGNYDYRHAWWDYQNTIFHGGNLDIERSGILASVGTGWDWAHRSAVSLEGLDVTLDGSAVVAQQKASGQASVDISAGDFTNNEQYDYENFYGGTLDIKNPVTTFSDDGELVINFIPSVGALVGGNGSADVSLYAGRYDYGIAISDNADVRAQILGSNWGSEASVELRSGEYHRYNDDGEQGESLDGGVISISGNSNILADNADYGGAEITMDAGGYPGSTPVPSSITIDGSKVRAHVANGGYAQVSLKDGNYDYSNYEGEVDESHSNGHIDIKNGSHIEAEVDQAGKDWAEVYMEAADVSITDSFVTAEVKDTEGNWGHAEVDIDAFNYERESGYDGGYYNWENSYDGTLDISGSTIKAISDAGEAGVYFETGANADSYETETGINISGSTVLAQIKGLGDAEIYIGSDYSEIDLGILSSVADMFDFSTEDIGGPIAGPIYINGSTLTAESHGPFEEEAEFGTASVALATEDYLSIADSTISASDAKMAGVALYAGSEGDISITGSSNISAITTDEDSIAGVVALAGYEIDAGGTITADGGAGFGVVGMLAGEDLEADNVVARGNGDVMPLLEKLLSKYYGDIYENASLEIKSPFTYGSGILLASEYGDITLGNLSADAVLAGAFEGSIYDLGDVNAHLLGMLAAYDIGCMDSPIRTNVDILAALSTEYGDIYVDEANDIQLGWVLPFVIHDSEESSFDAFLGVAVAANEGDIFIRSQGDMTINSVLAPYGGVFLQSEHGSMYAGKGWDPFYPFDLAGPLFHFDFLSNMNEDLEYAPVVFTFSDPAYGYYPPFNLIAGGYSYLSTPEGTIGVGTPDLKDPSISGELAGFVWPDVEAVTGEFGPGIDLSRYTPPGLVYYTPLSREDPQIWPAGITDPAITSGNPLWVDVQAWETGDTRALPDWFYTPPILEGPVLMSSEFPLMAGLTLEIGPPPVKPNPIVDNSALLASALTRDLRAYYEVMSGTRFQSIEPATPTNFFGYHPLIETDMSAFDGITLDAGAYDFISNGIKSKKALSPYYGL